MTAAYRVFAAERKDVVMVTVACPNCGTAVSLSIETAQVPEHCSSCGQAFRESIRSALAALGRFHREAKCAESDTGKPIFRFDIRELEK